MKGLPIGTDINTNSPTAHLVQLALALFTETHDWIRLDVIYRHILSCNPHVTYDSVRDSLQKMACTAHTRNGPLQKKFDPRDDTNGDLKPGLCGECNFGRSGTVGCIILEAHQKRLLRGREF